MFPRSLKYGLEAQEEQQGSVMRAGPWLLVSCTGQKKKKPALKHMWSICVTGSFKMSVFQNHSIKELN